MKKNLLSALTALILFLLPNLNFAQTTPPPLGTAANYVLFTKIGSVTNSGTTYLTHITGNVGTNSNPTITGFGNIDGVMTYTSDPRSVQGAVDVQKAYDTLAAKIPTNYPASPVLGGGQILYTGVHSITNSSISLNGTLTLDAQNDSNAVFIFKLQGVFSTNTNSKVALINGAKACNVFWKGTAAVNFGTGTRMKGTLITNGAISIGTGDTLEGRALTINGGITITTSRAFTPIGCGSPVLTGPIAPWLATAECYGLFSSTGTVSNSGVTNVSGDVGSNSGTTTGFNSLLVSGTIHPNPDASTARCAFDLGNAHTHLAGLPVDIQLMFPAQFGRNLILTPHTYLLNAATVLTDSVYLDGQDNADAVFVIRIAGALSTSVNSRVLLINGTQAKNVYWQVEGAAGINDNSVFCGTLICNNGSLGALNTGVVLNGRALTTTGALTTTAMSTTMTPVCFVTGITPVEQENSVDIYPNPFGSSLNVAIKDASQFYKVELMIYNVLGENVKTIIITREASVVNTLDLPSGIYYYNVMFNNHTIQSGKLISNK